MISLITRSKPDLPGVRGLMCCVIPVRSRLRGLIDMDTLLKLSPKKPFLTPDVEIILGKSGLTCHACGSDRVYELEEVSPSNWNRVINVFYLCNQCGKCWRFEISTCHTG